MASTLPGALAGIRVIDLSRVLAGPLCTQMLADHGALVTKVEPPAGDETRTLGPPFNEAGDAAYFSAVNRGKRGIALDLAHPEGQALLLQLLEHADVLVENFLPGTMARWGLDYDSVLKARFPRLVYCAISGFGSDGPLGGLPGYDAILQAMCGLMSVNGDPASGPTRIGVPIVDHLTGYTALTGILMALFERERSGLGQRVEATLSRDAVCQGLMRQGVPVGPVNTVPEAFGQAHVAHRAMRVDRDGYHGIGLPTQLSRTPGHAVGPPPTYGQHTDEVLQDAGLSPARIAALRQGGVLPRRRVA